MASGKLTQIKKHMIWALRWSIFHHQENMLQTLKIAGVKLMDMINLFSIKRREAQVELVDNQPPQKDYNSLLIHLSFTKEMAQLVDKQLMLLE